MAAEPVRYIYRYIVLYFAGIESIQMLTDWSRGLFQLK